MASVRAAGLTAAIFLACGVAPAAALDLGDPAESLARTVEQRAASTDFAALEAFGAAAQKRPDREGLNRLYHVSWIFLNQGEFERASLWNRRLSEAARRQMDERYLQIARLNQLTIRYDEGELEAADEMRRVLQASDDWFVRAHAARLTALAMIDQGEVGEGLKLLSAVQAEIPPEDSYADTALGGVWEMVGMGLMELNDVLGAAAAFHRFEVEHSVSDYPRPDFDSLYNLADMAVRIGDLERASRLYATHHRLTVRANLPNLSAYDAVLCARVADGRGVPLEVLRCLEPLGEEFAGTAFVALDALPLRAIARARTGQIAAARRDIAQLRSLDPDAGADSEAAHAAAELLMAEGRVAEAFSRLRDHARAREVQAARQFSAGIRQVTGDMQQQLADRRRQLETARANTRLQEAVIRWQNWIVSVGLIFLLCAAGVLAWQWRQARQLRSARARAEDANRAKSEFLANMSHEIRTPLNGVVGMADALARRDLGPQAHEMVDVIRSSASTLERLLSDILDSARIESGEVRIDPAPFDLGRAVREVVALWRIKADERGVDLLLLTDPELERMVIGDGVRLRQVLTNLVSNALKFTDAGSVTVEMRRGVDGRVRFEVIDTGVGFDAAQRRRIFGRFQQADGSITRRYGGTGLGLAISSDLVRLMGGRLDCDGAPDQGARFWFEIDLPPAPEPAAPLRAAAARAPRLPGAALRVLLADDHEANRKVVEVLLSAISAELTVVEDGRRALDVFAGERFDLVLMDMQMPVMDGLTATREIRKLEAAEGRSRTPVVMLTANAMSEHVEAGREAGADGHLTKPLTLAALLAGIEAAVRGERVVEAA